MKMLTVRAPWSSLIVSGHKRVECRSRNTLYRGLVAIHSAGKPWVEPRRGWLDDFLRGVNVPRPAPVFSAVLGTVRVVDVLPASRLDEMPEALRPWALDGCDFYWILADPRPLARPLPFTGGRLGLYDPPPALLHSLARPADTLGRRFP